MARAKGYYRPSEDLRKERNIMSENSKSFTVVLGLLLLVCLGGLGVMWVQMSQGAKDHKVALREAAMAKEILAQKLNAANKKLKNAAKPLVVEESVVSESEFESLQERLRQATVEVEKLKKESARLEKRLSDQQVGMKAAARLQGELRKKLGAEEAKVRKMAAQETKLQSQISTLKSSLKEMGEKLKKLGAEKLQEKIPGTIKIPGDESAYFWEHEIEFARLVCRRKSPTLESWLGQKLEANPQLTPAVLGAMLSKDDAIAEVLAALMTDEAVAVGAIHFARASSSWTWARAVERGRSGLPQTAGVVEAMGRLLVKKSQDEGIDLLDVKLDKGVLGRARLRVLEARPLGQVPMKAFFELIDAEDKIVAQEARAALLAPKRRSALLTAIAIQRGEKKAYPSDLEAAVFEDLEKSIATAVAMVLKDSALSSTLRNSIVPWAEGKKNDVLRAVAMETLILTCVGSEQDRQAWGRVWQEVWPDFAESQQSLLTWLENGGRSGEEMKSVLVSPAFGVTSTESPLFTQRLAERELAKRTYDQTLTVDQMDAIYLAMSRSPQPLFIPLIEGALSSLTSPVAMDIGTQFFRQGRPSGPAWFQRSLEIEVDRRMQTLERLFDIGTEKAHEVARSIVGKGDPRATFQLVELCWERGVSIPKEDIVVLLRSPFLDATRMYVYMALFERCLGGELKELVTEALFDSQAARPETLLEYLAYGSDQKLLPLIGRFLGADQARVREGALRALVPLETSSLTKQLLVLVRDPDAMVRLQLARCLGSMGQDAVARGGLLVLSRDKHPFVREAAFDALAHHQEDNLLPALRFGVEDRDRAVAVAAAKTLIRLGHMDDKACDLLFRTVEDPWYGPDVRSFLLGQFKIDYGTRDEWRAWWSMGGRKR